MADSARSSEAPDPAGKVPPSWQEDPGDFAAVESIYDRDLPCGESTARQMIRTADDARSFRYLRLLEITPAINFS